MHARSDIAPSTLGVEFRDYGIEVEHLDNRITVYRGIPQAIIDTLATAPDKEIHIFVADPTETEGVMMCINDLMSRNEVLESNGASRIIPGEDEEEGLFPDVLVRWVSGHRLEIEADLRVARGYVFAFVEDDWGEDSYEFAAE